MGPRPHLSFCACKTASLASELLVSMGPSHYLWFLQQNSDFWNRITSLYRSQTSPVVLCMQNSVISIRITSLYWPQPSSVVFTFKTAHYGPEILVSMGPRPYLSFCALKTTWLASDSLVSIGPNPHLWFSHSKQRIMDQKYQSLWVPDLICRFVHAKQRD